MHIVRQTAQAHLDYVIFPGHGGVWANSSAQLYESTKLTHSYLALRWRLQRVHDSLVNAK